MKHLFQVALAIVAFLVIGAWIINIGLRNLLPGLASRTWPSTPGHVTSQEVETYEVTDHSDSGGTRTFFRPAVDYTFHVYDHTYKGTRVRIGEPGFKTQAGASRLLQKVTDESQCQVFYDPYDPNNCTLVKGIDLMTLLGSLFTLLGGLTVMAVAVSLFSFVSRKVIGGSFAITTVTSPLTRHECVPQHSFLQGQTGRVSLAISQRGPSIFPALYPRVQKQEVRRHLNQSRSVVLEGSLADSD
jgi:hypothetical protein